MGTSYLEYVYNSSGIEAGASDRGTYFAWQYLFIGGRRFGKYLNNHTYFIHQDSLGTTTTITDETGSVVQDLLVYPWGQQWNMKGSDIDIRFAGMHQRDSETNLDPTHFRM